MSEQGSGIRDQGSDRAHGGSSKENSVPSVSSPDPRSPIPDPRSPIPDLLSVQHLTTVFDLASGVAPAVIDVSFHVAAGETLCLVGESGSGKSVTALSILRLVQRPGRIAGGTIVFKGRDLLTLDEREMQKVRGAGIALVFQEPMTALNPVFTIGNQIEETLMVHGIARGRAAKDRAVELLEAVSIPEPKRRVRDYPHQLSGGLRQRALIALALACGPSLVIADEPTTALDVTIQAQILDLLRDLQKRLGLALLLITHDLGVVAEMADRVAVMYAGRIVEEAPVRELFHDPRHPYTRGLLASIPGGARGSKLKAIHGTVPPLGQLPPGCAFAPRCPHRFEPCDIVPPGLTVIDIRYPRSDIREPKAASLSETDIDPRSSDIGHRISDIDRGVTHTARCYLYSPAVDPQVLPEVPR
jgi:oligopeptide/dipeptide ABC transporter ATP-binding protein